jgi:two-component system cell cycle sensor histidine kinase/response regulator CckA
MSRVTNSVPAEPPAVESQPPKPVALGNREVDSDAFPFDELFAELELIVWEADLETLQPTFLSRGIEKLLGYPLEEFLVNGRFWERIVHPEDREAVHAIAARARGEGATLEHEFRAIARDGRIVWLRNRLRRIEAVRGQGQRLRGVAVDITEHKRVEERLRLSDEILQRVPALVLVADRDGRITYVSPSAQGILGYRPEELLGDGWWLRTRANPEERERERNAVACCARGERPLPAEPYEHIAHHRNGQPRWFLWHDSPGPNQTLIGVGHDITARKRAEQQLKERTAYLHALIENSPLAIVVLDSEQRVQMCNRAFTTLFGYRQAEILGSLIDEFLAPPELKSEAVAFSRLALAGQTVHATTRRRRKDGSLVTVEVTGVPLIVDRKMVGGIGIYQDITERLRAEEALREAHHLLETIIQTSPLAIIVLDKAGRVKLWNRAAEQIFGWSAAEVQNQLLPIIPEEQREEFCRLFDAELQGHSQAGLLLQRQRKDGSQVAVRLWSAPLCDASGQCWGVMGVLEDVTEKRALEEQLRQTQKLEVVGRLAGGVAHDFNNLLMVIFGSVELLLDRLPAESPLRRHAEEIQKAAHHAANLTRQLLAFSRKQVLQPRGLDLNVVVRDMEQILRRLIPKNIELVIRTAADVGTVRADPGQLEQVILNLAVNARDAMPAGGTLILETANVELDAHSADAYPDLPPGTYGMLAVTDTGCGMDRETLAHIFEPFFTTKSKSGGTGLGLATVYGVVMQSGGHITVDSEPGRGSTFKIYLPRVEAPEPSRSTGQPSHTLPAGSETLLLVEDEEDVRTLSEEFLRAQGYRVLPARDGEQALTLAAAHDGPIHLLITDVVMPGMSGRELVERLQADRPEIRVVFTSGCTDEAGLHYHLHKPGVVFLQKPFPLQMLARKIREVLGESSG